MKAVPPSRPDALLWVAWALPTVPGVLVLLFLVAASSAASGASMPVVISIALASAGTCIGGSIWLMLRNRLVLALLLACFLLPMTFMIGIGVEEAQQWLQKRGK